MAVTPGSVLRATLGFASLVGSEAGALIANGSARPQPDDSIELEAAGGDQGAPSTDWVHLWWGALAEGGDRAARAASRIRGPLGAVTDVGTWILEAPPLAPATQRVRTAARELVERGRAEDEASRVAAAALADRVLWRVVRSEVLDRVVVDVLHRAIGPALDDISGRPDELLVLVRSIVGQVIGPVLDDALPVAMDKIAGEPDLLVPVLNAVVDEALEPMMRAVLPQVFAILADDPEAVRSLVRDQSTGVAAEMAGSLRIQAARADDRVDRAVRRVLRLRRAKLEEPAPEAPRALPPAEP